VLAPVHNAAHQEALPNSAWEVDMTTLRRQIIQDMILRGLSDKTQEACFGAVAGSAQFYGRSPERISDRL
jgi:hypothetical protein